MKKFDKIKFMQAYKKTSIKNSVTQCELLTRSEKVAIATMKMNKMYHWMIGNLEKQIAV